MADVRVEMNASFVTWLRTSPDSPVNDVLAGVADLVLTEAEARAPVADKGVWTKGHRHYTPPGFLRSRLVVADKDHADDGTLTRFVGTRLNVRDGAYPYPLAFVSNEAGSTLNRGGRSRRSATDYFLSAALEATPFTIWGD